MGFENFIAKRILSDKERQDGLSRPIVGIAVLGVIIGVAVMILTLGITRGFQDEIRAKVTGSVSHIRVNSLIQTDPQETPRFHLRQSLRDSLLALPGVNHVQGYALRPGILETQNDIEGVLVKGIGPDHDTSFLSKHLVDGNLLEFGTETKNQVLISSYHARRLQIWVDSFLTIYLIKGEEIRPRKYRVRGVYATGMEQIDHELILLNISHLQKFARWGLSAQILVEDSCFEDGLRFKGLAFGGSPPYSFSWSNPNWQGAGPHKLCIGREERVQLLVGDANNTLPDTAVASITFLGSTRDCACNGDLTIAQHTTGGSSKYYTGGQELLIDDFNQLEHLDDDVYRIIDPNMRTLTIKEQFPEIFSWLELLDKNVQVVIMLMLAVSIINMTSALLIIILERTSMIGVLKAMGTSNASIRRIFLIDAAYIMGIGILLGTALGVILGLVQKHWKIVKLPAESYYMDSAPVELIWTDILLLDLGTLLVCLLALILPTFLVTRIAPAKAIKVLE